MEAGQQLLHYRLIERIGEGGMGVVWKAEDTKLHRSVALKVLPAKMAADPERRARFEREARAVAALNHPNIVTLHSVEEAAPSTSSGQAVQFITMELVEGKTLTQLLPKDGFPLRRMLEIAIPLADAVSRAHRAGITHRDLKPDNIMFDTEGRLRVLDFGLAKLQDPSGPAGDTQAATVTSDTAAGRVLGTVAYMSPEQAEGKNVDARTDVFSLGTILYEMTTGERPFRGDTHMSTIGAILKDEPASITELKRSLPRHAGRIIRRCLAKDPDRRYQTALDVRNELEELRAEIDSGIHDAPSLEPTPRPRRSTGRWVALGIAAVVVIALAFPIVKWLRRDSPDKSYTSVPLTAAIGQDAAGSWSPEGEFIAFARTRDGSIDLMVQPVAGGEPTVRVGDPGDQRPPRWSPDGRYLAYISTSATGTPVYLVPPHGGTPRKLIQTGLRTLDAGNIDASMGNHPWDRESRTLLVTRVSDSGQMAIFRVDRDTGEAEQLSFPPGGSDDRSASYSFDGKRIVFERRAESRGALMTMPAAGGGPEILLADEFDNNTPAFRRDDRHVLFLSDRGAASFDLWELDLGTGNLNQLTFESREIGSYSVSATNRIIYQPFWHDTFLHVVDVATGERRQLTSHTKDNFGARFSPDGRTIAYHSTRTGDPEVFLHHLDGGPETRVTEDPGWDVSPDWSPDGEQLIFASNRRDRRFRLFIANKDGGGERVLVDQPISARDAYSAAAVARLVSRWSPDGERISYLVTSGETTSLWTVGPDGEGATEVLRSVGSFAWYRDNRHGIYMRPHGSHSEMVAVDLETGEERSLFIGAFMEMEVAPDGSAVAFCYGPGHMGMGLALLKLEPPADPSGLPRAVGEPEYVVRTEGTWHVHNGGWSPDSKSIVYTQDQDYGDLFELVETR
jgi:serine/threonine protein kinase